LFLERAAHELGSSHSDLESYHKKNAMPIARLRVHNARQLEAPGNQPADRSLPSHPTLASLLAC